MFQSATVLHQLFSGNSLRGWISLLLVVLAISQCQSQFRQPQVSITENDTVGYRFLQSDSNQITNKQTLEPFFKKLFIQRVSGGERISIVHIGDSHIQGNFMTEQVRYRMQDAFGDAGRGVIFPYKLAGTNGPRDYLVETDARWKGSNCQRNLAETTPYGLTGFCLETTQDKGDLIVRARDTSSTRTSPFTKVTIYYRKSPKSFPFEISDDVTNQQARRLIEDDYSSTFFFDRPVVQFKLLFQRTSPEQLSLAIDGICLENELAGIVYHSIGVNGGKFMDFARAAFFSKQVGNLQPDLIILSMGTNEAQGASGPKGLYGQMQELYDQLKANAPGVPILLTTPADSYLRGKGFNPYMPQVSDVIRRFAKDHNLALWDLYALSGGEKSAHYWKSSGLMSSDSVHYSKAGYLVQGKLFYQSLMNGYNIFVDNLAQEARSK
ncbi:MAG: hypothetical protein IPL65_10765 [Lewinellaceae bacterium]|nr:hypothetical protein [Lewinellaceae bacterium]